MSLAHPVFPPENNASTNLPTAFANLNAALRALDGADTLVIDAGATPLNTVLSRIPQVLAVHGTPSALDGNGRYVLRLPSNGATDQILIAANRTASPLRLETADGANALVASLAAGRIEAFVLSGSTIGAYALSSTRAGKAATAHTHPLSEITNFDIIGQCFCARRNAAQSIPTGTTPTRVVLNETLISTLVGASLNTSTGEITIAQAGLYRFIAQADMGVSGPSVAILPFVNNAQLSLPYQHPRRNRIAFAAMPPISLSAGDVVDLRVTHDSGSAADILTATYLAVERIR